MKRLQKILLSIPSVLFILFFLTYFLEPTFLWSGIINSMNDYYLVVGIIQGLTIIQLFVLIRFLWKIKEIKKKVKTDWTLLLIIFNSISSLIFIWSKIDEFQNQKENN